MDEADRADQETQRLINDGILRANIARQVAPCGVCFSGRCLQPVGVGKKFCNADCAADWEKWDRSPNFRRL